MKNLFCILLLLISTSSFAQRVNYSDLILSFNSMNDEEIRNE